MALVMIRIQFGFDMPQAQRSPIGEIPRMRADLILRTGEHFEIHLTGPLYDLIQLRIGAPEDDPTRMRAALNDLRGKRPEN